MNDEVIFAVSESLYWRLTGIVSWHVFAISDDMTTTPSDIN